MDPDNGNVLVVDANNHRIQIFDKNGQFIHKFGKKGSGKGDLNDPLGIAINSKKEIIVSENDNHRLQIFDYNGNHLRFIGMNEIKSPVGICLDDQDNIYVGNWNLGNEAKIKAFNNQSGKLIHSFGDESVLNTPCGVAFHHVLDKILVANYHNHTVCTF